MRYVTLIGIIALETVAAAVIAAVMPTAVFGAVAAFVIHNYIMP